VDKIADTGVHALAVLALLAGPMWGAEAVVIPGATHFVHLDRPEHGRDLLLEEIVSFVGGGN